MKRIVICSALVLGAVIFSIYSYNKVKLVESGMTERMDALIAPLAEENKEELATRSLELKDYWDSEESHLVHFVRHSSLDAITTCAARLPGLANHGEFGEFSAEVENMRSQIKHIYDNERLSLVNLF